MHEAQLKNQQVHKTTPHVSVLQPPGNGETLLSGTEQRFSEGIDYAESAKCDLLEEV